LRAGRRQLVERSPEARQAFLDHRRLAADADAEESS
jgi:hypothetical protein